MKKDYETRNNLKVKIEYIRSKLIHSIRTNGINHPDTLEISYELDEILNKFTKLNEHHSPQD